MEKKTIIIPFECENGEADAIILHLIKRRCAVATDTVINGDNHTVQVIQYWFNPIFSKDFKGDNSGFSQNRQADE